MAVLMLFIRMNSKLSILISAIRTSSLIKSSSIYTICSFINAAIPLILLPILTTRLSPSDYGIVAMFQLVVAIIYPLIGLNLEGAISRKYYDKDNSDFSAYIGTCLVIFIIALFIISLLLLGFIDDISKVSQIPEKWVKYVVIVASCQFLVTLLLAIFQIKVQPTKYGSLQISQTLFNIGLTLYLVIILNKTWEGRIRAQIITGLVFAIVSILILIKAKLIKFKIRKVDILHALRFGVPLIPHALGGILFTAIDRFFLTNLIGLEQTGNYSVAYQLGAVIGLLTVSVNNAFVPWLFENLNKNSQIIKEKIVKGTYLYFLFLVIIAILLLLLFPLIIEIFVGKSFTDLNTYITLIVFGFVFQGMYYMVTNYITYANKTYLLAIITITIGLLKIPITYFSILWFGAIGASFSYCFTFFLFFISTWILSSIVYKMPWILAVKSIIVQNEFKNSA